MKLASFLIFINLIHISAAVYSQDEKLSLKLNNATLKEMFTAIEKQTNYKFLYRDDILSKQLVTINVSDMSLKDILNKTFENSESTFRILDNHLIAIAPRQALQQQRITGRVTDSATGDILPGVSVMVKGTTVGAITDLDGKYSIDVPENATLTFTMIGYSGEDVSVSGKSVIDIKMVSDVKTLQELVVVGYGTQKKETLTGAISNINSKSILASKNPNLIQNLQGKVAGLQIRQSNSMPGAAVTSINIRGFGTPIFVIDGVLRDGASEFQRLDPNDIESISVLKDGSAAIYGIGADNGVIIVTTKRGEKGKMSVSYSGNLGWSTPTNVPKMVNGAEWVQLQNEMKANLWNGTMFSQDETQKYIDGTLPGYESVNWYNQTMKSYASREQHNISVRGGNDASNYFVSLGYNQDGGLLKSNAINYNQINLRSNLTVNLVKNLTMDLNLSGRREDNDQVAGGFLGIFKGTVAAAPFQKPYINNDPNYPAYVASSPNPVALSRPDLSGYQNNLTNFLQSSIDLNYNVPFVKGLKLRGLAAYDYTSQNSKYLNKQINFYTADATGNPVIANTAGNNNIAVVSNASDRLDLQAQVSYSKTIAENHNISATLVYEQKKTNYSMVKALRNYDFYTVDVLNQAGTTNQQTDGSEDETTNKSYVGRFNYDFKKKYLLEYAFRYDGTYRYKDQWGFFPYVSGGWRISEENFMKNNLSFIDNLKLRASYGETGEDTGGPFQFISGYRTGAATGYEFVEGTWTSMVQSPALVNQNITWVRANTTDLGLDLDLFHSKFGLTFDVYQRDRTGILATRYTSLPNTFGASLPQENLNSDRVKGIDFSISHNNKIGDLTYGISANFNISQGMRLYIEQGPYQSSYSNWTSNQANRNSNIVWGYQIIGHFDSWDQIRNYPVYMDAGAGNSKQLPGDPIYKDVNGDGIISSADMVPLYRSGQNANGGSVDYNSGQPPLQYGLNLTGGWKGFDVNVLFQGAANYTVRMAEAWQTPFYAQMNAPEYMMDRWHMADPFNKDSQWIPGMFPATRDINSASSVHMENDFWRKNASYLRLKNIELGYTFSKLGLSKLKINSLRIYFNASNLVTFCDKFLKDFDPERGEGPYGVEYDYPLTKAYNVGLNVTF